MAILPTKLLKNIYLFIYFGNTIGRPRMIRIIRSGRGTSSRLGDLFLSSKIHVVDGDGADVLRTGAFRFDKHHQLLDVQLLGLVGLRIPFQGIDTAGSRRIHPGLNHIVVFQAHLIGATGNAVGIVNLIQFLGETAGHIHIGRFMKIGNLTHAGIAITGSRKRQNCPTIDFHIHEQLLQRGNIHKLINLQPYTASTAGSGNRQLAVFQGPVRPRHFHFAGGRQDVRFRSRDHADIFAVVRSKTQNAPHIGTAAARFLGIVHIVAHGLIGHLGNGDDPILRNAIPFGQIGTEIHRTHLFTEIALGVKAAQRQAFAGMSAFSMPQFRVGGSRPAVLPIFSRIGDGKVRLLSVTVDQIFQNGVLIDVHLKRRIVHHFGRRPRPRLRFGIHPAVVVKGDRQLLFLVVVHCLDIFD